MSTSESNIYADVYENILKEIEASRKFELAEEYYAFFERTNIDIEDAIEILITANTLCATFALIQLLGNKNIVGRFGWREPEVNDIKSNSKYCQPLYGLFSYVYSDLYNVVKHHKLSWKGISKIKLENLTLDIFTETYNKRIERKKLKHKTSEEHFPTIDHYSYEFHPSAQKTGNLYSDYEYGLSDW